MNKPKKDLAAFVEKGLFYKTVVEDGSDIIFIVDFQGKILYHNPAVEIILGYPEKSLIDKIFFDYIHPDTVQGLRKKFKNCTRSPYSKNIEFQFRKLDDGYQYFEFNAINLLHKEGFEGFILDCRDIEQRIRDSKELRRAKEAKEKFLANMSHEIRTPINGIAGMISLLSGTNPSPEQQKYLGAIKTSTDNLKVIINDILDISAIESGKLKFEKIGFKINNLLPQVIENFLPQAKEKNIDLNYSMDQDSNLVLLGDPVRLSQILINLISNALKFTLSGKISINVKTKTLSDQNVLSVIEINDTGIGIPADKLETIFDSFRQADESVSRKFGGTGLGLSIVKQLVGLQNGEIKVSSFENKGTKFTISLPFELGSSEDLKYEAEAHINQININSRLPGLRVLLVEDNEINRLYASNLMKNWECEVDIAENGLICLEKLTRKTYDVILMDIQMPVMDGFEATKSIRTNFKIPKSETPIIALTANAIKGDNEKCIAIGMNEYLSKPFIPHDLFSILSNYYKGDKTNVTDKKTKSTDGNTELSESPQGLTNLEYLASISNNDKGFMKEMLKTFVKSTPASISEMKKALSNKDYNVVGQIAHRIKPSITFMGINSLKLLVKEVELLGKAGEKPQEIEEKAQDLISNIEKAIIELKSELKKLG